MNEEMKLINMADVKRQEVEWLWYPYIPIGKLTILQGDPGEGKTMLVLAIAAMLTKGEPLPQQEEGLPPITVIYQTAEDGLADTVKPRLEKAGADCKRVVVIDDSDSPLSISDERLEQAILLEKAKLLILDPMQAYLGADVDMHRANEVRPAFRKLAGVAERTNCAVLIVGHMNKMSGAKGMYRGLGSIDIPAIARSILFIGRSKEEKRYLAQLKNSLAPLGDSLEIELGDSLAFGGVCEVSAEQLLCGEGGKATKRVDAIETLEKLLKKGEMPCNEVYDYCEELGISRRTVERAKQELGIRSTKKSNQWYWLL